MDEELAMRLHEEEMGKLERMQRERAAQVEASNAALTAKFDDVQARINADALFTYNQLKNKSLEKIQKLYEKEQKWINDFVPMDSEMVKDSGKKDDDSRKEAESSQKQAKRDDSAINVESLATKYRIVDWKTNILTENMMYYQIIRADRSSKNYKIFSEMLDDFDREDVVDLYSLIKERLFDSCGVHVLLMDTGISIHMMVENKYPLIQEMLTRMLNRRLEVDHESTMAFELIKFIKMNMKFRGGLLGIRGFYNLMLLVQVCAAAED
ncbi:hypothetical protein Tco_1043823 [Tanacetum coccineum]|uniref:Uncharacterized protein n=1 Tax=Tanacetum coccineum TaxID=301880 RepID=A0ABQ5GN65_9ASTR